MKRLVHLALSFERDTEYRTNVIYHKYVYEKSKNKQFIYVISQFSLIKFYLKDMAGNTRLFFINPKKNIRIIKC